MTRESEMIVVARDEAGTPTVWCDPEIVDLVTALNAGGIPTVASCSGHGETWGNIALRDGRELFIAPSFEAARKLTLLPVMGDTEPVSETTAELIRQIRERDAKGRAKYGVTLDRGDLSHNDWLQHMAEELMDAAGYALAAKRTHPAPPVVDAREPQQAQVGGGLGFLKDPNTVHAMMLRGQIAIPSWRNMVDLRGEVPNGEDVQLSRIAELQEQLAQSSAPVVDEAMVMVPRHYADTPPGESIKSSCPEIPEHSTPPGDTEAVPCHLCGGGVKKTHTGSVWCEACNGTGYRPAPPRVHARSDASAGLAEKHALVPCDCGCGRSCCAMCGTDVGFVPAPPTIGLPPFSDAMGWILGRPNFACCGVANAMRCGGIEIPRKAEAEQARVIYWLLGLYLKHGDNFGRHADEDLARWQSGMQSVEGGQA